MGEALRKRRHGTGRKSGQGWHTDETYLKSQDRWCYVRAATLDGRLKSAADLSRAAWLTSTFPLPTIRRPRGYSAGTVACVVSRARIRLPDRDRRSM